ncbi:MAG: hypothetical protein ACJ786_29960 [Catenulispora sp.]
MADAADPGPTPVRALAADLGNRANDLGAADRSGEIPALWEEAIAGLDDEESRARLTLAYAWYQALHGAAEHGVRLAAGLRECGVRQVESQVRVLIRNRWRVEPEAVRRSWSAVAGDEPPAWVRLSDEDISSVAKWISASSWDESEARYRAEVSALRPPDFALILEEIALGGDRALDARIAVHRALLALGGEAGYACLRDEDAAAQAAGAAIERRDRVALRACGTIEVMVHGRRFLGAVHVAAAEMMTGAGAGAGAGAGGSGGVALNAVMAERISAMAREAEAGERELALNDLAAIGGQAVASLVALVR